VKISSPGLTITGVVRLAAGPNAAVVRVGVIRTAIAIPPARALRLSRGAAATGGCPLAEANFRVDARWALGLFDLAFFARVLTVVALTTGR
jgi:hypothetical protein